MAKKKQIAIEETKTFKEELLSQLLTLCTSGFGLVAALAWNETIQQIFKEYLESRIPGTGVFYKLIYALLVTFLAVLITYQLSRLSARFQRKNS